MLKCQHIFNIYEQDKFRAQLSWAWKKFYNLGACFHLPIQMKETNYCNTRQMPNIELYNHRTLQT